MALMKAALVWERFVLKDLTRFGQLAKVLSNSTYKRDYCFNYYLQVELVPSGDVVGLAKGVGGLVKDVVTFKWAQVVHRNKL